MPAPRSNFLLCTPSKSLLHSRESWVGSQVNKFLAHILLLAGSTATERKKVCKQYETQLGIEFSIPLHKATLDDRQDR
jgi:hypothetical protein